MSVFDSSMPNYEPPLQADIELAVNSSITPIAGYTFYSGGVDDFGAQLTVDMKAEAGGTTYTEDYQQTYVLNTNIPSNPPANVTEVKVSPPNGSDNNAASTTNVWSAIRLDFTVGLLSLYLGLYIL